MVRFVRSLPARLGKGNGGAGVASVPARHHLGLGRNLVLHPDPARLGAVVRQRPEVVFFVPVRDARRVGLGRGLAADEGAHAGHGRVRQVGEVEGLDGAEAGGLQPVGGGGLGSPGGKMQQAAEARRAGRASFGAARGRLARAFVAGDEEGVEGGDGGQDEADLGHDEGPVRLPDGVDGVVRS